MQIQLIQYNQEKVVTSTQIAESLQLSIRSVDRLINKYTDKLNKYGEVRFEITPNQKKVFYLNENQALFLGTLQKNNELVVEFKQALVTAFDQLRHPKQPKTLSTLDLLKLNLKAIEQLETKNKQLESENTKLATRDLEVKTQKEYKWKEKELRADRGRTINYYVMKHFFTGNYKQAHDKAKKAYMEDTYISLPMSESLMSLEQKKEYLEWLSKIK